MEIIRDKRPFVSVIIDTYNYAHFIEEAIDSVLQQTFPRGEVEIIVVDDGSTDDTRERVHKYKDSIRYFYKDNAGQASALNFGVEKAKGEIVAFLDSDDYWGPHKLDIISGIFQSSTSVDFVYHNLHLIDNQKNIINTLFDIWYPYLKKRKDAYGHKHVNLEQYLKGKFEIPLASTSGMSIRTQCLKKIVPIPRHYRICADGYMCIFIPFHAREFFLIREPLGYYRIHGGNLFIDDGMVTQRKNIPPDTLKKKINILQLDIQNIEAYGQATGHNVKGLKKKHENLVDFYTDQMEGKRFTFAQIKILCHAHSKNLRNKGLAQCILDSYHYRKRQVSSWMKKTSEKKGD